ncbi:MAG: class I SAM-dependent methyltransferase [Candidatus Paceibacteria bacterium]
MHKPTIMDSSSEEKDGYYTKARIEMLEFVPLNAKKILDIGCGSGIFSALVKKQRNAEVWGVEMANEVAVDAKKKIDVVLVGDITTLLEKLPEKYFDCIICNDVLEHLTNPYSLLSALKEKLSESGVIVFSLPNVRYFGNLKNLLIQKDWHYQDEGILDRTHFRFFTEKSMRRMFNDCGYEIIAMHGLRPIDSWKFSLLNTLVLGNLSDARYLQFAGTARPK